MIAKWRLAQDWIGIEDRGLGPNPNSCSQFCLQEHKNLGLRPGLSYPDTINGAKLVSKVCLVYKTGHISESTIPLPNDTIMTAVFMYLSPFLTICASLF